MLEWLKRFDADSVTVEELLTLSAFAKSLRQEYDHFNIAIPEWLDDKTRQLTNEVITRGRDALELRLKEIDRAKTKLMTADEKRAALAREEAELRERLAQPHGAK